MKQYCLVHSIPFFQKNSIDHAILVDVHFFRQPNEPNGSQISEDLPRFYTSIQKALRPNGTLVILEHKETYASSRQVTQEQMVEQLKPIGFVLDKSGDMIDRQYFMIFKNSKIIVHESDLTPMPHSRPRNPNGSLAKKTGNSEGRSSEHE